MLLLLQGGAADVLKRQGEGDEVQEIFIVRLEEYACFGEQSFLLGQPSMATVRSEGYSEIIFLGESRAAHGRGHARTRACDCAHSA